MDADILNLLFGLFGMALGTIGTLMSLWILNPKKFKELTVDLLFDNIVI